MFTFEVLIFIAVILALYILGLCYCSYINFTYIEPKEEDKKYIIEELRKENEKSSS